MNHYGFIKPIQTPEDWVFGSGKITGEVLQENRDWRPFLPHVEYQSRHNFETYGCVSFTTLNAVEILEKRLYNSQTNWSDRYLAKQTGTEYQNGNSPQVVAEYLRKEGVVPEIIWPYPTETFSDFYAPIPRSLERKALEFVDVFSFKHDYVSNNPHEMWEALKYCPLGVSVDAWKFDAEGYTYKAGPDTHWTLIVHGVPGDHWLIWDTYDNQFKKQRWNTPFEVVKGYNLQKQTVQQQIDLYTQLVKVLQKLLAILKS